MRRAGALLGLLLLLLLVWLPGGCSEDYDTRCHREENGVCVAHADCQHQVLGSCSTVPGTVCCPRDAVSELAGHEAALEYLYATTDDPATAEPWGKLWFLLADQAQAGDLVALWPTLFEDGRQIREMAAAVLLDNATAVLDVRTGGTVVPGPGTPVRTTDGALPLLLDLSRLGAPVLPCGEPEPTALDLAVHVVTSDPTTTLTLTAGDDWAACDDPALLNVPQPCDPQTLRVRFIEGQQRYGQRCVLPDECPGTCATQAASDVTTGLCLAAATCRQLGGLVHPTAGGECGVSTRCGQPVCCLPATRGAQQLLQAPPAPPPAPASPPGPTSSSGVEPVVPGPPVPEPVAAEEGPGGGMSGRAWGLWLLLALLLALPLCCAWCGLRCVAQSRRRQLVHAPVPPSPFSAAAAGDSYDDLELDDLTLNDADSMPETDGDDDYGDDDGEWESLDVRSE